MKVEHVEKDDGLEIKLIFTLNEIDCLKHDLPGIQGIVDWYRLGPSAMKIESCKKRMKRDNIEKIRESGLSIPADDIELIDLILSQEGYQDREKREQKN